MLWRRVATTSYSSCCDFKICDVDIMSSDELRKEFVKLRKEFMGASASKLKKHELEHRMAVLKQAMALKVETPEPETARSGPPAAREVKTKKVAIDEETEIIKPVAPKDGKAHVANYKKKAKAEETAPVPAPAPAPASVPAEKPKKARKVPPKVVLEEEPVAPKPKVEKPKVEKPKKSKATAAPKMDPPSPEDEPKEKEAPAPVVVGPIKLPGGVRKLPEQEVYFN